MKVYYCNVEPLMNEELFCQGMKYADRDRRIKIEKLKHPLDKARFLGCFLLYRYLWIHDIAAGNMTGHDEASLCEALTICGMYKAMCSVHINVPYINIDKNGKPDMNNIFNVHISFSHSGSIAAVAYQRGEFSIGMDI